MKPTIKIVADHAKVSTSAVSIALNNKPGVSDETRERIIRTAKKLGYEPLIRTETPTDPKVRFLKISRHEHTINKSHNYFIDAYVDGITNAARQNGAVLEFETYQADIPLAEIISKIEESPQINGYLILGTELSLQDIDTFVQTGKNIVFMDTFQDYIAADFVDMNNTDAVYKIIKHFLQNGHLKIGLIKSSVQTRNFFLREKAYFQVMHDLGIPINKDYIFDVDSTYEGAYSDMLKTLKSRKAFPTALFSINDIIALGCLRAFQESGFKIPEQISIAGFDNIPISEMIVPQLTSIDVSKKEIGQTAMEMLLLKLQREQPHPPRKTLIGGRLIKRSSVRKVQFYFGEIYEKESSCNWNGYQGTGIGKTLFNEGWEVSCWNRTQKKAEELVNAGAILSSTPAEAASDADFVITMLWSKDALESTLNGENGLFPSAKEGKIYIDMSTQLPESGKLANMRKPGLHSLMHLFMGLKERQIMAPTDNLICEK